MLFKKQTRGPPPLIFLPSNFFSLTIFFFFFKDAHEFLGAVLGILEEEFQKADVIKQEWCGMIVFLSPFFSLCSIDFLFIDRGGPIGKLPF